MSSMRIDIDLAEQRLRVLEDGELRAEYSVSTSRNGAGEREGSECTPRGRHVICAKIGAGAPLNAVFVGRQATGETWSPQLAAAFPDRDFILTRILWLDGCEEGRNRGGNVDTKRRYIYIHGTPDTETMGVPGSHGCIRMRNADVVALFDAVKEGTEVVIGECR